MIAEASKSLQLHIEEIVTLVLVDFPSIHPNAYVNLDSMHIDSELRSSAFDELLAQMMSCFECKIPLVIDADLKGLFFGNPVHDPEAYLRIGTDAYPTP